MSIKSKKIEKTVIFFIIFIISSSVFLFSNAFPPKEVEGVKGIVNLKNWNEDIDKLVSIKGEWEIVPLDFVDTNLEENLINKDTKFLEIPNNFDEIEYSKYGYYTLKFKILLNDSDNIYGFRFGETLAASKIWINGKYQGEIGTVGKSKALSKSQYKILYAYSYPEDGVLDVVIHTCNYEIPYPRIATVTFGKKEYIQNASTKAFVSIAIKIGMLIFLILMGLLIRGFSNSKNKEYSFIFLCAFSLIRLFILNERILMYFFSTINYEFISKIAAITYYLWLAFLSKLFAEKEEDFSKLIYGIVFIFSVVLSGIALFFPSRIYDRLWYFGQILGVLLLSYILYYLAKKIINGASKYIIIFVGMIILGLAMLNDMLLNNMVIKTIYFAENGMLIFLLIESYYEIQLKFLKLNKLEFLSEENFRIREISIKDSLTGVYNRRYLDQFLKESVKKFVESGRKFSIIFIDIDKFKNLNDKFGHRTGDLILRDIAEIIKSKIDPSDVLGRYGGEEFVVIMPDTKEKDAVQKAEIIRIAIKNQNWDYGDFTLTVSIGVYENNKNDIGEIYNYVDNLMYKAKKSGRNKVMASSNKELIDFIY